MKEDEFVSAWIQHLQQSEDKDTFDRYDVYPEARYDHYGNRGSVDLHSIEYLTSNNPSGFVASTSVFEVKSTTAIQEATGANEILRQYNKMCKYFYQDESNLPEYNLKNPTFELVFLPTNSVIKHVYENRHIYINASDPEVEGINTNTQAMTIITFRIPDSENITPVHINFKPIDDWESILSHAEVSNEKIYERMLEVTE